MKQNMIEGQISKIKFSKSPLIKKYLVKMDEIITKWWI